jgi:hypothetical protein
MKKIGVMLGTLAAAFLAIAPASLFSPTAAFADQNTVPVCNGVPPNPDGTAVSGTYQNLTLTGNHYVDANATLTVNGNLTIATGACLDAFSLGNVKVGGNILVEKGAILGLGCSPGALGPPFDQAPCKGQTTTDTVGGNIIANQPWSMYLTADTIRGNVVSNGGGPGVTFNPYVNFPIKENTIGGNLIVQGWQGAWAGALRNQVAGNLIFRNNNTANPDANEVATNTVGGNLICTGNAPATQFGDSGGLPNTVAGQKLGQCTGL